MSNDSAVKIHFDEDDLLHLTGGLNDGLLILEVGEALLMASAIAERFSAPLMNPRHRDVNP